MHIPDGFLDARTCAATYCAAGAGLALAVRRVTGRWSDRTVPLLGVMSAFVFAGQMVNFPIAAGTSGHLFGGVLAAVFLGPAGAALALATVLVIQCFLFQDGGVTALGANILNMSLLGTTGGYFIYRFLRSWLAGPRGLILASAAGGWFSVVLAAAACSVELALSGTVRLDMILPVMVVTHAVIGVAEAFITAGVLAFVLKVRPDLLCERHPYLPAQSAGVGFAFGLAIMAAGLLLPFASSWPDGLEWVAGKLGFLPQQTAFWLAPFAEYRIPEVRPAWLAVSLAWILGTILVFGITWGLARWLRRSDSDSHVD
ncbi:MAG: energy-coupling factor ABC transporter permease [Verrucomicrobiota bacterium]